MDSDTKDYAAGTDCWEKGKYEKDALDREIQSDTGRRGETEEMTFNVILLGDSGVGKTSFLAAFSDLETQKLRPGRPTRTPLLPSSQSLQPTPFTISLPCRSLCLSLIDTPGYGQFDSFLTWQTMIETFIMEQAVSYYNPEPDSPSDPRIHLCLYFLEGTRVKESDLKMLYSLQEKVPLLPILAKSETMTLAEVLSAKLNVIEKCADAGIRLVNATELPKPWTERMNRAQLGPCPPFALISYCEPVHLPCGVTTWGRKYHWGVCEVENPAHSDYSLLCEALLHVLPEYCIALSAEMGLNLAHEHDRRVRELREKSQKSGEGGIPGWASRAIRGLLRVIGRG